MISYSRLFALNFAAILCVLSLSVRADVSTTTIQSLSVPDRVDTSIGTLEFKDGAPTAETARKVSDALD